MESWPIEKIEYTAYNNILLLIVIYYNMLSGLMIFTHACFRKILLYQGIIYGYKFKIYVHIYNIYNLHNVINV